MIRTGRERKGIWELVKFLLVSGAAGILQLVLANVLPLVFDGIRVPIPTFLQGIFDAELLFNVNTARGAVDYARYVVNGAVTWGYVIPFFMSNLLANVYAYFQNRRTTFKSNSSNTCFIYYLMILIILILFSTWLQGLIVGKLNSTGIKALSVFSRTIAAAAAGLVQLLVLFPLEKFVLLRDDEETINSCLSGADNCKTKRSIH